MEELGFDVEDADEHIVQSEFDLLVGNYLMQSALTALVEGALEQSEFDDLLADNFEHVELCTEYLCGTDDSKCFAHYGVKGMRWGVRRSEKELAKASTPQGTVASRLRSKLRRKGEDAVPGSSPSKSGDKIPDDGSIKVTSTSARKLSEDADRVIRVSEKGKFEMSNQDLQDLITRAEKLKRYQELFEKDTKTPIQKRLEELETQAKIKKLETELTPSRKSTVKKFISASKVGFETYQTIDKKLNGQLTAGISQKLGVKPTVNKAEQLKAATDLLRMQRENLTARAELNRTIARDSDAATGDAPSKAVGYTGAGKRSANGRRRG